MRTHDRAATNPARWRPCTGPACRPTGAAALLPLRAHVTPLDTSQLPNEGRIEGFSGLQRFGYRLGGLGPAAICLHADPKPAHPEDIGLPPGSPVTYVLTLLVGISQTSLPSLP
jgi:hypothetical protein